MKTLSMKFVFTMITAFLGGMANAQSPPEIPVEATWVDEGYVPDVPVSGRIIIGAMLAESGRPDGRILYVRVGSEPAKESAELESETLCINLISRDGSYTGVWKVPLAERDSSGWIKVQYTTKEPAFYEMDHAKDLVALAAFKDRCDPGGITRRILPVTWQWPDDDRLLRVFVNSSRMRTLLAIPFTRDDKNASTGVEIIECKQIEASHRIAFDRQCDIDIDGLEKEQGQARELHYDQAALLRYRGPNRAPVVSLPLLQ
ncbi:hypothetical protein FGL86_03390 [Pistricoccus aurantiacus]|uniref:Uncharacterized protein n=1 Tax=Pistricoccus aurantiacus TaxID=1883414 RepID=A0A5B8STT8_9GAMM|nr:hypothetical protein [Pistricoccus aurantiacus]QEA38210.1 hypothetical protein FGL86_03390 [Pistricoccus aurantiacus]